MTAEYVAYHAAERPGAIAVVSDGREITFSDLDRDIRAMSRALRGLGLSRGHSVAIRSDNLYVHWLLLLGCERLGVAAASFRSADDKQDFLASVDLVLAEPPLPPGATPRHHPLTAEWVHAALTSAERDVQSAPAPDDPVRIVSTSGTTGPPKRFLVLRRTHDTRVAQWILSFNINRSSRYLVSLPMTGRGSYDCGCACLRAGGTIVLETRMTVAQSLCVHAVTHLIVLPIQLKAILEELPPDFAKPREFTIVSFGGRISPELRERTTERLATALCETYGTSEACTISMIWRPDTDGFGTIPPRVEVQVLDERGNPLPIGRVGRVRLRTEVMCAGYLDNDEATARMFEDGWFFPRDLAIMRPGRQLRILGRFDDLLNIGGHKYLPAYLEELLLRRDVADDVGVCSVEGPDGIDRLCIAVSQPGHDDTELLKRATAALREFQVGPFLIVKLSEIPRNASGKIERARLKAEAVSVLREA